MYRGGRVVIIAHLTTVHQRTDTRIRIKQVASLAEALESKIALFVQDGQGSESDKKSDIQVTDTGPMQDGRLWRMTRGAWRMWRAVHAALPRIAHFHDPELIPVGIALKLSGVKVIYDVHEDVPRQIFSKHWISPVLRRPMALLTEVCERMAAKVFDGIVTATPTISRRFPPKKTETVQNFPILSELVVPDPVPYDQRPPHFVYVGGITSNRGAKEMVQAIGQVQNPDTRLQLAGAFQQEAEKTEIESLFDWERVDFHGWASRSQVASLLGRTRAGLVVLHPTHGYLDALPVKMFEYMAAGLPVIASDFPLWREIVDSTGCGLLVNSLKSIDIARAMDWILDNSEEAEAMGKRGRKAVEEKYNWERESKKLVSLYKRLLKDHQFSSGTLCNAAR